jgi:hypothetical protein
MKYYQLLKLSIILLFISIPLFSSSDSLQNINSQNDKLKIFVNCGICDMTFLKENLQFVDYVRNQQEADVYIMSTSQPTGAGGSHHSLFFIGQNSFSNQDDTIKVITEVGETWEEKRKKSTQLIKVGLMRYISGTDLAKYIKIDYQAPKVSIKTEDNWDLWFFRISSNMNGSGEKSYRNMSIWSSINASRISENWKTTFSLNNNYSGSWYIINDSTTIKSINLGYGFNNLIVKSIDDHWSIGESFNLGSSEYNNIKLSVSFHPSIEFNIFPYSQASRRQFVFLYGIGAKQFYYNDTTIYLKTQELLFEHSLRGGYEQIEPWGSLYLSAVWANYLHNFKYNNLNFYASINWRIFKGFSINTSGGLNLIHNQLNLPKSNATPEEILTRQRMLESQYSYWISGGLSYSFGSMYNNIVNPRFDF